MTNQTQNFENHGMTPKGLIIATLQIFVGIVCTVAGLFQVTSTAGACLVGTGALLIGTGSLFGFFVARGYATKLQDRIIRLEMRLRLQSVLPDDLQGVIGSLTIPQLVALRFAPDAEMPELVREVMSKKIEDRKAIKQMVKDWQGDYDRV
jgi:hypothetical protein